MDVGRDPQDGTISFFQGPSSILGFQDLRLHNTGKAKSWKARMDLGWAPRDGIFLSFRVQEGKDGIFFSSRVDCYYDCWLCSNRHRVNTHPAESGGSLSSYGVALWSLLTCMMNVCMYVCIYVCMNAHIHTIYKCLFI